MRKHLDKFEERVRSSFQISSAYSADFHRDCYAKMLKDDVLNSETFRDFLFLLRTTPLSNRKRVIFQKSAPSLLSEFLLPTNADLHNQIFDSDSIRDLNQSLRDLIDIVDNSIDVFRLLSNPAIMGRIFESFLFTFQDVEYFDKLMRESDQVGEYYCECSNLFEYLKTLYNYVDQKKVYFYEENKYVEIYNQITDSRFSTEQKSQLLDILRHSNSARKNLFEIVDSNIFSVYTFSQLKEILTKDEKKKKIKMNF